MHDYGLTDDLLSIAHHLPGGPTVVYDNEREPTSRCVAAWRSGSGDLIGGSGPTTRAALIMLLRAVCQSANGIPSEAASESTPEPPDPIEIVLRDLAEAGVDDPPSIWHDGSRYVVSWGGPGGANSCEGHGETPTAAAENLLQIPQVQNFLRAKTEG